MPVTRWVTNTINDQFVEVYRMWDFQYSRMRIRMRILHFNIRGYRMRMRILYILLY